MRVEEKNHQGNCLHRKSQNSLRYHNISSKFVAKFSSINQDLDFELGCQVAANAADEYDAAFDTANAVEQFESTGNKVEEIFISEKLPKSNQIS